MVSQNPRRDQALESIARHLGDISKSLKVIAENSKKGVTVIGNVTGEVKSKMPDPFNVPQEPVTGLDIADKIEAGKDEPKPDPRFPYAGQNPYFQNRSTSDSGNGPNPDRDFSPGV